jgi:hypothetical protein
MAHLGGFIPLTSLAYSSWSSILSVAVVAVRAMSAALSLHSHQQQLHGRRRQELSIDAGSELLTA